MFANVDVLTQRQRQLIGKHAIAPKKTMTGRYMRKSVPLEIRGLPSRLALEEHPTSSLDFVEQASLPPEFSTKLKEAISSYQETPASSNRSSPTITDELPSSSPSIVPGDHWATGNTTERSSVDSNYCLYEFDRQAARTVQQKFDEIDSVLYERQTNHADTIYNECKEWGSQFPHLRILGRQVISPQDTGYEVIRSSSSRPSTSGSMGLMDVTENDLSGSQDSQGLSISGQRLWAIIPPIEARSRNSGTPSSEISSEFSHLEEEVFDVEGEYEEIIAVDYKDILEDSHNKKQMTPWRRQRGYPPITPNACLKDSVASSAFDCMWQEIISWIRPVLKKYSLDVLDENKLLNPLQTLSQTLKRESTPGPPSRENSTFKFGPRAYTIIPVGSIENRPADSSKLDGVLQISQKLVMQRENSKLADPSESQLSIMPNRPASSSIVPGIRRPASTRYPQGRGRRLAPISGMDSRSKTPSVQQQDDEKKAAGALLVRKINPPGVMGRLSSPTYNARNGALPPIGTPNELEPIPRLQKKLLASRASSAVDKDLRLTYKDRFVTSQESRPSTTHAMRSETPVGMTRRASTPFGSAFNSPYGTMVSRHPSFGPGGMVLGITGSGLQPTSEMGHPQEILEDPEGLGDEHIRPNQWTPSTPSHNPYKRGRQMSSLVRS